MDDNLHKYLKYKSKYLKYQDGGIYVPRHPTLGTRRRGSSGDDSSSISEMILINKIILKTKENTVEITKKEINIPYTFTSEGNELLEALSIDRTINLYNMYLRRSPERTVGETVYQEKIKAVYPVNNEDLKKKTKILIYLFILKVRYNILSNDIYYFNLFEEWISYALRNQSIANGQTQIILLDEYTLWKIDNKFRDIINKIILKTKEQEIEIILPYKLLPNEKNIYKALSNGLLVDSLSIFTTDEAKKEPLQYELYYMKVLIYLRIIKKKYNLLLNNIYYYNIIKDLIKYNFSKNNSNTITVIIDQDILSKIHNIMPRIFSNIKTKLKDGIIIEIIFLNGYDKDNLFKLKELLNINTNTYDNKLLLQQIISIILSKFKSKYSYIKFKEEYLDTILSALTIRCSSDILTDIIDLKNNNSEQFITCTDGTLYISVDETILEKLNKKLTPSFITRVKNYFSS
jgi:hypothetical protein